MPKIEIGEPNPADPNWIGQYWAGFLDNHSHVGMQPFSDNRTGGTERHKVVIKTVGLNRGCPVLLGLDIKHPLSNSNSLRIEAKVAQAVLKLAADDLIFKKAQAEACLSFQAERDVRKRTKDPVINEENREEDRRASLEVQKLNLTTIAEAEGKLVIPSTIPFPYAVGLLERCIDIGYRNDNPNQPIGFLRLPSAQVLKAFKERFGGGSGSDELNKGNTNIRYQLLWSSGELRRVLADFQPFFRIRYIAEAAQLAGRPNSESWQLLDFYHSLAVDLAIDQLAGPVGKNEAWGKERQLRFDYSTRLRRMIDSFGLSEYRQQIDDQVNRLPKPKH